MPPHHDHHHEHGHHHGGPGHHHHKGNPKEWEGKSVDDLPPHLKEAASTLGWSSVPSGKMDKSWESLSHEERKAAEAFGYHPKLWNGDGPGHHGPGKHHGPGHHGPGHHHDHPSGGEDGREEEEKKDNEEEDDGAADVDVSNLDINDDEEADDGKQSNNNNNQNKKKKPTFKLSKSFGTSDGGDAFDHGNNRSISKIKVYHDSHCIKALEVNYANGKKEGGRCSGDSTTFELENGEFITSIQVRSNKFVQSLAFRTNKGNVLGPVGGKGYSKLHIGRTDSEGEEVKVSAPMKLQLCGFKGSAGAVMDNLAFRWGPIPN